MFRKIIVSVFTVSMLQITVFADEMPIKPGSYLTLRMCLDISENMNPQIITAKEDYNASKSRVGQTRAEYFPQLDFSSGYSRGGTGSWENSSGQYSSSLGLSQNIYDFGKTSTQVKISELNAESAQLNLNEVISQVVLSVKQAYYQVLYAQEVEKVAAEAFEQSKKHLKQAQGFYETGKSPKFDVTKAEVDCTNAQIDMIKAQNSTRIAIVSLNTAMGIPDAPEYTLENTFVNRYHEIKFETALETAYKNRSDMKITAVQRESAEYSVSLARKGYYPALSGSAGYGWNGSGIDSGDDSWNVGLMLNIPIFNGFSTRHKVDEGIANLKAAESREETLKQSVFLEVKQAYLNFQEAVDKIPVAEMVIKQARENMELADGRYETGVGSPLEVTDGRLAYSQAQNGYIQAVYEYHNGKAVLDKSMGVQ